MHASISCGDRYRSRRERARRHGRYGWTCVGSDGAGQQPAHLAWPSPRPAPEPI